MALLSLIFSLVAGRTYLTDMTTCLQCISQTTYICRMHTAVRYAFCCDTDADEATSGCDTSNTRDYFCSANMADDIPAKVEEMMCPYQFTQCGGTQLVTLSNDNREQSLGTDSNYFTAQDVCYFQF